MRKQRIISLCLASALALSLAACNGPTDEQNSEQPTVSTQPTAEPTPTPPPIPYNDVSEDSTYYDAVVWAYKNGIATDGETFEPASTCTRGQVMTFLWRANGSPEPQGAENPFNDVSPDAWYYKPALWAYENGVASGAAFNPGNPCTNAEALTFLWRAEGKPAASVYNSAVALAASGQYYARPAAWGETNGLFSGVNFDPAVPCSRADLMTYLYWANEQWTLSEEDKAAQAEFEQIIYDAQLFEVHGSGLVYADYVDVDNDGKLELLTLDASGDSDGYYTYEVIAAVYGIMDGHAEKICEQTFSWIWQPESLSICTNANQTYLWSAWEDVGTSSVGDTFFKVENGAFAIGESISVSYASEKPEYSGITETEYNALDQKYTNKKGLLSYNRNSGLSVQNRGLLPEPKIMVNGVPVGLSAKPYLSHSSGAFMVPLRDTLEAMGIAVYANSDASIILASTKKDTLVITNQGLSGQGFEGINNPHSWGAYGGKTYQYSMNSGEFQNIEIEFTERKAFVPLHALVTLFNAKAEWSGKAGAIQIVFDLPDSSRMSRDEIKKLASFDMERAQKTAANKGYGNTRFSHYDGSAYGLTLKNGKAIWKGYAYVSTKVEEDAQGNIIGAIDEYYLIEVASDGTVTANPNDKVQFSNPQF